jgi:carbon monoxide dehydrogenase subunit G
MSERSWTGIEVDRAQVEDPMKLAMSTEIDCTPRELWLWLDDPERRKQWMNGVSAVRNTSRGPRRRGSTSVCVIQEGRTKVEYTETVLEHDPERRTKLRMEAGRGRELVVEVDFKLANLGRRTRLDLELEYATTSFVFTWLGPLIRMLARVQMRALVKRLKDLAEGKARVAASA